MAYYPPGSSQYNGPQIQQPQPQYYPTQQPTPPPARRKLSKPVMIGLGVVAAIAVLYILALVWGVKIPPYQMGQSTEYVKLGQQGMAYRIAIDPTVTDDQLKVVFNQVIKGDHYKLHTVFCFSSLQLIDDGWGYDVALISDDSGHYYMDRK